MHPFLRLSLVCFVLALLCLAVICVAGCSKTAWGKALDGGVIGAGGADLHSTRLAIDRGAHEANPAMDHGAWTQGVLKAAGLSAVLAGALLLETKGSPLVAHLIRVASITLNSVVAARNYQIVRQQ